MRATAVGSTLDFVDDDPGLAAAALILIATCVAAMSFAARDIWRLMRVHRQVRRAREAKARLEAMIEEARR